MDSPPIGEVHRNRLVGKGSQNWSKISEIHNHFILEQTVRKSILVDIIFGDISISEDISIADKLLKDQSYKSEYSTGSYDSILFESGQIRVVIEILEAQQAQPLWWGFGNVP